MAFSDRTISIAALAVAAASALFTLMQYVASDRQLRLNAQQLRPHVSYLPTFFRTVYALKIDMYLQNESPLPANVLFTDAALSIDGNVQMLHHYSIRPDILYQQRGGVSTLPLFEGPQFVAIEAGKSKLLVATCVVYASTASSDSRRWFLSAVHEYVPGATLSTRHSITENEVAEDVKECSAKTLFTTAPAGKN